MLGFFLWYMDTFKKSYTSVLILLTTSFSCYYCWVAFSNLTYGVCITGNNTWKIVGDLFRFSGTDSKVGSVSAFSSIVRCWSDTTPLIIMTQWSGILNVKYDVLHQSLCNMIINASTVDCSNTHRQTDSSASNLWVNRKICMFQHDCLREWFITSPSVATAFQEMDIYSRKMQNYVWLTMIFIRSLWFFYEGRRQFFSSSSSRID